METHPPSKIILELISYNQDQFHFHSDFSIEDIGKLFKKEEVNWINLDGLDDPSLVEGLQKHFNLHTLLVEDITNDHRPKAEEYDDYLFITLKMLYRLEGDTIEYEQISFVLGDHFLISFQEKEGDLFDPFRERIRLDQGRVRKKQADYLLYRLLDIIMDHYYVVLDAIGENIDSIEDSIYSQSRSNHFQEIQKIKKELIFLRKVVHPLRETIGTLIKNEFYFIQEENIPFYRDLSDNVIHLIEALDTYWDLTSSLIDIHINTLNTRLNEIIRLLTVISTIFIPLTFIVGVYGMNFKYMPELQWELGYLFVWLFMIILVGGMLFYFRLKKWL